jgi:hypothetical protein
MKEILHRDMACEKRGKCNPKEKNKLRTRKNGGEIRKKN